MWGSSLQRISRFSVVSLQSTARRWRQTTARCQSRAGHRPLLQSTAVQAKLFQSTAVQAKLLQSTMSRTRVPQMSMTRSMMTGPFGHAPSARPSFLMIHHRGSVVPVAGRRVTIAWEDAINQDVTKGSAAIACVIMPCTALGAAGLRSDCAGHPASVSSAWKTRATCPSNNLYNIWRKV